MNNPSTSRRQFLLTSGTTIAALCAGNLLAVESPEKDLRLAMMLQGSSTEDLTQKAKAIAAAGFAAVQLTFFYEPNDKDLETLASTLNNLKLRTVAFGTYVNLLRPDDDGFMGANEATMKRVATHSGLFGCQQFITWSGSYATRFDGEDPRNHTRAAIKDLQRALRDVMLPILEPIDGQVALEPYFRHILGTIESAEEILDRFPLKRVGLVLDPPNFITPGLYAKRDDEMRRLFRQLGRRIQVVHFKDLKLNAAGNGVDLPGPGRGEMNYRLLLSELRQLQAPLACVIEHINAETAEMLKARHWVEQQMEDAG